MIAEELLVLPVLLVLAVLLVLPVLLVLEILAATKEGELVLELEEDGFGSLVMVFNSGFM